MSKEIPTIGKVWLIFISVIATVGVVSNLLVVKEGLIYLLSAAACAGELVGLIFMLKGRGLNYLYLYSGCYALNAILVATLQNNISVSWLVGFLIGIAINICLTYLSIKSTIKKN